MEASAAWHRDEGSSPCCFGCTFGLGPDRGIRDQYHGGRAQAHVPFRVLASYHALFRVRSNHARLRGVLSNTHLAN